ncbi:MAG TPA: hypothetical protein VF331_16615 [Polyangiales bacterium]
MSVDRARAVHALHVHRLTAALFSGLLITFAGCGETLEVLRGPSASRSDAGAQPGDAGSSDDAGAAPGCDSCGPLELCSVDRCLDASGITAIAAGLRHTCRLHSGFLQCWGSNDGAQLGLGNTIDRHSPTRVGNADDWVAVSAGQTHSCGLRAPGALHCWGENLVGQLGTGDGLSHSRPTRVGGSSDFRQVACGGDNCCALRGQGALYCWGGNLEGSPGQGDSAGAADITTPSPVAADSAWKQVSVGFAHTCAVREDGALYCWGRNVEGQLGIRIAAKQRRAPARVGTASDWRMVAAGHHHSCGVRGAGALYCWGKNESGALGIGSVVLDDTMLPATYAEPVRVGLQSDWSQVAVGWFHSCATKRSGALYCWGQASDGQLGLGDGAPATTPSLVTVPSLVRTLALGSFHTCALDADRQVYCWGANAAGQVGTGDTAQHDSPSLVH